VEDLVEENYLKNPNQCPVCQSDDITAHGGMEGDGIYAWENVICHQCKAEWTDQYTLTGMTLL